jgi:hypothetical protein
VDGTHIKEGEKKRNLYNTLRRKPEEKNLHEFLDTEWSLISEFILEDRASNDSMWFGMKSNDGALC